MSGVPILHPDPETFCIQHGGSWVALCGVEGCPRAFAGDGQDETCGLLKIGIHDEAPECGAVRTLDLWDAIYPDWAES